MNLDSLLTGENASFIDEIYLQWQQDPTSVEEHWASIFTKWDFKSYFSNIFVNSL